ncbi:SDR family oxidoreductase [Chitinophaga pinensis]|uniref:NAD-dependent epimerase/dehydratase n=1 Tax=Chitinophaga pinensis (strain ATCC 43595 / DSM 2588 / LMG 13176 / NBRC 15968 / NCIMB 11800 / UQM 2034) TaxID=485918 RepID=A0A979GZ60_CHIPD|nr:SDR family oxidoreductase [Chitinophaga pinensis]ACU63681.1 NAD-dependent epimerase/dehydratase [Chitinophaga pinensis DSM 2588]
MRVFVTGASGFVGSAVVKELINAGHHVLGLARSEAAAKKITALGADVHLGDLADPESLLTAVANVDGVIHTGFNHDFSKFAENCELDRKAIEAMGGVLAGTRKPFIITSAIGVLTSVDRLLTEDDKPSPASHNPRVASELAAGELVAKGIKVAVVRLPTTVHGEGDRSGLVPIMMRLATEKGYTAYKDDGLNRWPAVHVLDTARLYRLIVEKEYPAGTVVHAITEEGLYFKDIATAIGKRLNLPTESKSREAAPDYFGWFSHFAGLNCAASSQQTQAFFGWHPQHATLMEDLQGTVYFSEKK